MIDALRRNAVQTPNAAIVQMAMPFALVYPILPARLPIVVPNVSQTMNVTSQRLVLIENVKILVKKIIRARESTPVAVSEVTVLFALATAAMKAIPTLVVHFHVRSCPLFHKYKILNFIRLSPFTRSASSAK